MKKVETGIFTLKKLSAQKEIFSIPSYQRPYVWGEEAINALFNDIFEAYRTNPIKPYFIGTILTSAPNKTALSELIDGQQRFTTLMLLAIAFKIEGVKSEITSFIHTENNQRIRFDIRDQVEHYIQQLINKPSQSILLSDNNKNDPYLKQIAKAIKLLVGRIRSTREEIENNELKDFADFIYQKVCFIKNVIPEGIDLNQLFSVMNNSGIQLEQTDILKSRLLKYITRNKSTYNAIWQACENMDNYFERNVCELFVSTNWDNITKNDLRNFDASKFQLNEPNLPKEDQVGAQVKSSAKTIADIISEKSSNDSHEEVNKGEKKYYSSGRSIISFSQLLLHAYRIYLKKQHCDDFETGLHASNLLEIFESLSTEKDIIEFLKCLWETRYYFDNNVVRWMPSKNRENRDILKATLLKDSKNNEKCFDRYVQEDKTTMMMLQSLLYYTSDRNRQYWISSYLYHCMKEPDNLLFRLEKIDDNLSLARNKKEASYQLMGSFKSNESKYPKGIYAYLREKKGTGFEHYWFQKLEYLLWKKLSTTHSNLEKFKKYRITSKNSVEHVFPQNEEYDGTAPENLNSFGNLTLLSVSQNSSYSNQAVKKKMVDFEEKLTYDTLKLKYIFESMKEGQDWNDDHILTHQKNMIELMQEHYSNNDTES